MSALAVALLGTAALVLVTFTLAAVVRARDAWRGAWEEPRRAAWSDAVARFCVEVEDDLPAAHGRRDRRLRREAMLEAAAELSGVARGRLAERFAGLGYVADAARELHARSFLVRVRAAEALGELGGAEGAQALRRGLADDEALVRIACANALTRSGARGVLPEVLAALAGGDDAVARGALTEVLLDAGPPAVDELRAALASDLERPVRWLVVVVLGELRAIAAVPDLLACLRSDDAELRARAAHALGKVGDPRAAAPLAELAAEDPAWTVRAAAAGACGALGEPAVAPALVAALSSDRYPVRDAAARSLVALGEPGLRQALARLDELEPAAVAQLWGQLDVHDRTGELVARAAAGERDVERLVVDARRAGASARLEEAAGAADARVARFSSLLLAAT